MSVKNGIMVHVLACPNLEQIDLKNMFVFASDTKFYLNFDVEFSYGVEELTYLVEDVGYGFEDGFDFAHVSV